MRPHGKARVDRGDPRALGVCDRCGALYNLMDLVFQWEWAGANLQNQNILVCKECLDVPNEGLRSIIFPADPEPVDNPRPQNVYVADNPLSALGWDPRNLTTTTPSTLGTRIGNMSGGGGLDAAFNAVSNKPFEFCAYKSVSASSYQNTIGINWSANPANPPDVLGTPTASYIVSAFTLTAPNDRSFLNSGATGFYLQGSNNGATWTTLYSGTTAGTAGETVTSASSSLTATAAYGYHQIAFQGDGVSTIAVAQVTFTVSNPPTSEI